MQCRPSPACGRGAICSHVRARCALLGRWPSFHHRRLPARPRSRAVNPDLLRDAGPGDGHRRETMLQGRRSCCDRPPARAASSRSPRAARFWRARRVGRNSAEDQSRHGDGRLRRRTEHQRGHQSRRVPQRPSAGCWRGRSDVGCRQRNSHRDAWFALPLAPARQLRLFCDACLDRCGQAVAGHDRARDEVAAAARADSDNLIGEHRSLDPVIKALYVP